MEKMSLKTISFKRYFLLGVCCLVSFPLFSQNIPVYLELNLNNAASNNPFSRPRPPLEILRVIDRAANDDNIQGIILNIKSFTADRSTLWELRRALERFKTPSDSDSGGKKIVAFVGNADIDTYTLATVADKIVMEEIGSLNILGYAVGRGFIRNTLEKLGIGVRELRYFEYKSAAEMYSRDSMSDADRRQYNDYLDDIFHLTRDTLKIARNILDDEFDAIINRDFIFTARDALERRLIDRIGGKETVIELVNELENAEKSRFVLYGSNELSLTGEPGLRGSQGNYRPARTGGLFRRRPPTIAVIYANGQTDMQAGMAASRLARTINELADNRRISAIVIRINSPGGSVEAAEHIAEAIRAAKEKKPVVVSMGQVAASGGYWASVYANHITATPYTITGSIGVIGTWFYDNGLNDRLGINVETLQRGNHADLLTGVLIPHRDLSEHEESRYQNYILNYYNIFIDRVSKGRGMEIDRVEAASQGRIFSGNRAMEAGLIDSVGGLWDAVAKARELAEIPEDRNIRFDEYPKPGFWERMMDNSFASVLFRKRNQSLSGIADLFLSQDIIYRLERNGQVMPILPADISNSLR